MRHMVFFCATAIVAVLVCFSVVTFGLATIRPAAAADVSASTLASPSPAPTQNTPAIADPQSQTPTIPLVPFQLTIADQTVSEPTSLSALTVGTSQTGASATLSADPASGNSALSADSVTTHVTQPAGTRSLALIPVSAGGDASGLILVSYGTAIVVLGVMRYWSFSFDETAEVSPELNNANVVYVRGSAYSLLDNVEYGHTAEGP
jgi:hypothetical protein